MPVSHLYALFGKMLIQVFFSVFNWGFCFLILSCMSCLYILDIDPLLVITFANVFSHSIGCLFVLEVSFAVLKLLSFIRCNLFISAFISFVLGTD